MQPLKTRLASPPVRASGSRGNPMRAPTAAPAAELPTEYMEKLTASKYYSDIPSVLKRKDPKDFSASDLRYLLEYAASDPVARELASYFVGAQNIDAYMNAIGLFTETKKYLRL